MAKFKLVAEVEGTVPAFGAQVGTGDTFDLSDERLIAKARANPAFAEVRSRGKKKKAD